MRRKSGMSILFTVLNTFLIVVILLVGLVFYAGYLFETTNSGMASVFGYTFHVTNKSEVQDSVEENTFVIAKNIVPNELKSGNLVTVVKKDGTTFTALYYARANEQPQQPYLFAKDNSPETISLTGIQIESISLHKYHSKIIGKIFRVFANNQSKLLVATGGLLLILVVSLIIVIARRESFKLPKKKKTKKANRSAKSNINITDLISYDDYVPMEHSKNKKD